MDLFLAYFEALFPLLLLVALIVSLFLALGSQSRRLEKHAQWLRGLEARVGNLHNEKREAYKRSLQTLRAQSLAPPSSRPASETEPPPLSEQKTLEVSEEMLLTLKLRSKKPEEDP